jgi:hypothetical protein
MLTAGYDAVKEERQGHTTTADSDVPIAPVLTVETI